MTETVQDVLNLIKEQDIKMVDFRFIDMFGTWQHFSTSAKEVDGDTFDEGLGFDGSSIRGFQAINESDMILIPDVTTAFIDPIFEVSTLVIICDIFDPLTRQPYNKDPRYVAQKAEAYLKQTGIADSAFFGPEAEFFLFDNVRYGGGANSGFYFVDSAEGWWNSGQELGNLGPNLGGQIPAKGGYFPVPPTDTLQDVRSRMVLAMEEIGIQVEVHHHEVGTAGQCEIDLRFGTLTKMADSLIAYKYIVKNVARQHGMSATFMPKPLFEDNGSGMHTHQSLWKDGNTLMHDENGYARSVRNCPATTSAVCLNMPRRFWPLLRRAPTPTNVLYLAMKRRSTWSTPSATVQRSAGFRCTPVARRQNGLSSVLRIQAVTPTWPSRRC